jgi:hypothetical protein
MERLFTVCIRRLGLFELNRERALRVNARMQGLNARRSCPSVRAHRLRGDLLDVVHQAVELPLR